MRPSGRVGLAPPLFLSTHLPHECHSEQRPIHTVLLKCDFSPNQQGTSCIRLNSVEPRVTSRIRRGYLPSLESGLLDDSTENTGCHEVRMGITLRLDTSKRSSEPSEFITQISGRFRRCVSKRIFFPSGDQVGLSLEAGAGSSVNCFWLLPSGFMVQT